MGQATYSSVRVRKLLSRRFTTSRVPYPGADGAIRDPTPGRALDNSTAASREALDEEDGMTLVLEPVGAGASVGQGQNARGEVGEFVVVGKY